MRKSAPPQQSRHSLDGEGDKVADIADRNLQKKPDCRRHAQGKSAEADMKRAEADRDQRERGDPYFSVKRLVKQEDRRNSGNQAKEEVLQKDQHRRGAAFFRLGQNAENRQFPASQPDWRHAPREQSRQAQAVVHRAEKHPREERPQIQPRDCRLRQIHGAYRNSFANSPRFSLSAAVGSS